MDVSRAEPQKPEVEAKTPTGTYEQERANSDDAAGKFDQTLRSL